MSERASEQASERERERERELNVLNLNNIRISITLNQD